MTTPDNAEVARLRHEIDLAYRCVGEISLALVEVEPDGGSVAEKIRRLKNHDQRDFVIEVVHALGPAYRGRTTDAATEAVDTVRRLRDATSEDAHDYRMLADHIHARLNTPDEDAAEVSLCMDRVTKAADYLESLPCQCPPDAHDTYQVCGRCDALGRVLDTAIER